MDAAQSSRAARARRRTAARTGQALTKSKVALAAITTVIAALVYLSGHGGPAATFAGTLKSDEEIVFFPTFAPLPAAPLPGGANPQIKQMLEVPIHGWIFEPYGSGLTREVTFDTLGSLLKLDEAERKSPLFNDRGERFLVDNERGKSPTIRLFDLDLTLADSTADGHTETLLTIPVARGSFTDREFVEFRLKMKAGDRREFKGRVQLIGPKGLSVVSDIDDTIKFSDVLDKRELIRNTFIRKFKPIDGMADVYRHWETKGAAFHYVSGSPWQLYEPLAEFAKNEKFPDGSFHLRKFRLKDRSALTFLDSPEEYKIAKIEPILKAFPERRFILVGDSGERDPEAYGELARRRPNQVAKIAIRNITDAKLGDERMKDAFRNVAPDRLLLFQDVDELKKLPVEK